MNHNRAAQCAAQAHVHTEDFNMDVNKRDMKYTDKDHADIKFLSQKWWNKEPVRADDIYEYAVLQYRLKDFEAALLNLRKLVKEEYAASFYLYADCLSYHSSVEDQNTAALYYSKFLKETAEPKESQVIYERGMCYAYGLGTDKNVEKAVELFMRMKNVCPEAEYELGRAYMDSRFGFLEDKKKAEQYLRSAYDRYVEQAIFALYRLYDENWNEFPYQRELTEAYSYQIGKYARVIHVNPSVQAYQNLARLYQNGFPGDTGEDDARFKRKADKYLKKIQKLKEMKG